MPLSQPVRKNSHILWVISLIQDITPEAQTKAELAEMVNDVVNTDNVDKTTLCLADTLQRFRFMIKDGLTEEEATIKCQEMAKMWQEDNAESLTKLKESKNLSILTWDEFLNWSEYEKTVKDVEIFYKENTKFRSDVDGRVRQELSKISNDAKITDPTHQTVLLKKYLFEECAFHKFAASKRFNYQLYKNPLPPAIRDIKQNTNFVPPGFMDELHFTQFNFTPKKQTVVQNNHVQPNLIPYGNIPVGLDFPPMWRSPQQYYFPAESSYINNRNSFSPVFSNSSPKQNGSPPKQTDFTDVKTAEQSRIEFAEFIEKSLKILPEKDQKKAIESLVKFTTNEILPLFYNNTNELKT
jgi:hypothetical protein